MALQLNQKRQRDFVIDLNDADTISAVRDIFFRMTRSFGFDSEVLLVMPARTDKTIAELVLETSLPTSFFKRFDELGGPEGCIVFDAMRQSILPMAWTMDEMRQRYRNLGRDMPRFYEIYLEEGVTGGVAIPLTTVDGSRHVVSYVGKSAPLPTDEYNELVMMTYRMFDAYDKARSDSISQATSLTARELEVVRWTAAGKTSSEIGRIMDLSDHTINAYMNNAFKKLDCVSRTQLVAKALRLRVIS